MVHSRKVHSDYIATAKYYLYNGSYKTVEPIAGTQTTFRLHSMQLRQNRNAARVATYLGTRLSSR